MSIHLLALKIENELEKIGKEFKDFHQKSPYHCPSGCGKCCFNPDVCCSPYELLPLALDLLHRGLALSYLEKAKEGPGGVCVLLSVQDKEAGTGKCNEYKFRPLVCRAFGVSGRKNKNDQIELSICKKLKEIHNENHKDEIFEFDSKDVPIISNGKRLLEAVDPVLVGPPVNINEALVIILEKVLLWDSYRTL